MKKIILVGIIICLLCSICFAPDPKSPDEYTNDFSENGPAVLDTALQEGNLVEVENYFIQNADFTNANVKKVAETYLSDRKYATSQQSYMTVLSSYCSKVKSGYCNEKTFSSDSDLPVGFQMTEDGFKWDGGSIPKIPEGVTLEFKAGKLYKVVTEIDFEFTHPEIGPVSLTPARDSNLMITFESDNVVTVGVKGSEFELGNKFTLNKDATNNPVKLTFQDGVPSEISGPVTVDSRSLGIESDIPIEVVEGSLKIYRQNGVVSRLSCMDSKGIIRTVLPVSEDQNQAMLDGTYDLHFESGKITEMAATGSSKTKIFDYNTPNEYSFYRMSDCTEDCGYIIQYPKNKGDLINTYQNYFISEFSSNSIRTGMQNPASGKLDIYSAGVLMSIQQKEGMIHSTYSGLPNGREMTFITQNKPGKFDDESSFMVLYSDQSWYYYSDMESYQSASKPNEFTATDVGNLRADQIISEKCSDCLSSSDKYTILIEGKEAVLVKNSNGELRYYYLEDTQLDASGLRIAKPGKSRIFLSSTGTHDFKITEKTGEATISGHPGYAIHQSLSQADYNSGFSAVAGDSRMDEMIEGRCQNCIEQPQKYTIKVNGKVAVLISDPNEGGAMRYYYLDDTTTDEFGEIHPRENSKRIVLHPSLEFAFEIVSSEANDRLLITDIDPSKRADDIIMGYRPEAIAEPQKYMVIIDGMAAVLVNKDQAPTYYRATDVTYDENGIPIPKKGSERIVVDKNSVMTIERIDYSESVDDLTTSRDEIARLYRIPEDSVPSGATSARRDSNGNLLFYSGGIYAGTYFPEAKLVNRINPNEFTNFHIYGNTRGCATCKYYYDSENRLHLIKGGEDTILTGKAAQRINYQYKKFVKGNEKAESLLQNEKYTTLSSYNPPSIVPSESLEGNPALEKYVSKGYITETEGLQIVSVANAIGVTPDRLANLYYHESGLSTQARNPSATGIGQLNTANLIKYMNQVYGTDLSARSRSDVEVAKYTYRNLEMGQQLNILMLHHEDSAKYYNLQKYLEVGHFLPSAAGKPANSPVLCEGDRGYAANRAMGTSTVGGKSCITVAHIANFYGYKMT